MSLPPSFLAIDLGASSGRAVVGALDGARIQLSEVHRFPTPLREREGNLVWDLDTLWREVRVGLALALRMVPGLRAVSVDTWGVDYVPLGPDGTALRDPFAYRDPRTQGQMAAVLADVPAADLYGRTGIQFLEFNSIFQVAADLALEPDLVARTETRLLIADYLLYRLSGVAVAERTLASTTGLFDAQTGDWAADLIERIGDEPGRWPRVVEPGEVLGPVVPEALPDGFRGTPPVVVATCSHDTAAAVAAVPADGDRPWAYVSSGTWALVGVERDAPVLTDAACRANFTNEAGIDGTTRFLKNRTGFWVLEECIREWTEIDGARPDYDSLVAEAAAAPPVGRYVALNDPPFALRGEMRAKIRAYCREHEVPVPDSRGALVRLVFESMAESTRRVLADLDTLTGEAAEVVHVVGGGAHNDLLNQWTADACGVPVVAGPAEATALGNLAVQARALGSLPADVPVRAAVRSLTTLRTYAPVPAPAA
ncbi:rhamnulokinase [Rubrivirga sp.]|uniref:rhamnulokinase n=1 Tax=Rubrivirga sp. TaxID=1885344 RepID=UPI003B525BF6